MHDPSLELSRRQVLTWGAASLTWLLAAPRASAQRLLAADGAADERDDGSVLVLVQLGGGNDGLGTVVPWADDGYHRARPVTGLDGQSVLRLDDYRGLHLELARLHAAWGRGELAIVEGVGYPHPNRSHFKSMEIWGTASERGKAAGDGWAARLMSAAFAGDRLPVRAVHIGGQIVEPLLSTDHPVLCFETPASYRRATGGPELEGVLASAPRGAGTAGGRLRALLEDARTSSDAVRTAVARYRPSLPYPDHALAKALRVAAALIDARIGSRILSVTLSGFDTHADQPSLHPPMLRQLDASLGAFLEDVRAGTRGRQVVVMVYSEFGRRVEENASAGTDHGAAAPMFLAGVPVRGGLHGKHPSLTELDDGDLVHTTDFRSVYAAVIRDWFGADPRAVLGEDFPKLSLLQA
ncbi:MAG TPA: DUF1501 domain-containing protein [Planctomycetota bacterium]|nr:DUF1501 domain-containing protein [Planctomycetota bacterium]